MNFDFQKMKPIIQADFDHVLEQGLVDLSHIIDQLPLGGDPYFRKLSVIEAAAAYCPVQLFDHYPFAFKLDTGEERHICYEGIGKQCHRRSGIDMTSLQQFREILAAKNLGSFNDYTDYLHRTLDHDKLLTVGFRGVYEECLEYNRTEADPEKIRYRTMVMKICKAVEKIGSRLRSMAAQRLLSADAQKDSVMDEDVRYNLQRITASVNTPWDAPVTMFDALNAILCTTLFISCLDGVGTNAYGSLDRLLFPFYERDLKEGRITREEAYFLIQCFLYKTDMHAHFNGERKTYDNGVSVMVGGCDAQGNPVYNEVTDMILDAYYDNKLINPKLNARASAHSPRPYLERLTQLVLSGNNNLVIENDDYIIPMFLKMGLTPRDARSYVGNGCQEVICPNQLHSRAFVYMNMVQVLLDTLRISADPQKMDDKDQKIYRYGQFEKKDFAALYHSFLANLRSYIRVLAEEFAPYEKVHHLINPEPMLSCFTADCIKRGRDITQGGARYYHKTLSLVGFGTLCDSLLSLQAAYENNSLEELLEAVGQNFAGHELLREKLLNSRNRFGHSEKANAFAGDLADKLAKISEGICNEQGIPWHTSLFTYYTFQSMGKKTAATPDGRCAYTPLSRQMNMAAVPVLTSAARSMAVLTAAEFHDVGIFDFSLPLNTENSFKDALTDYIKTCLIWKIPVLQTNVADIKTLQEEMHNKGTHPELVVRVCGYSAIFGQLSSEMQEEIIARLENEQ